MRVDLAAGRGVPLTVFQNRRYDPEHIALSEAVGQRLVGDVYRAEYRWDRAPGPPRPVARDRDGLHRWRAAARPVAQLVDQAVLLHGTVETVYAELDARLAVAEDDTFLSCRHTSGVLSHLSLSAPTEHPGRGLGWPGPRARSSSASSSTTSAFTEFSNVGDCVGWFVRGDEREPGPVVTTADQADRYRGVAGT